MTKQTVVQLGAGLLMGRSITFLREAGYKVCALDHNLNAPSFPLADEAAAIDVADVAGVTEYARKVKADLLLAVNDLGVLTAAQASQTLGLPGLPYALALPCVNKGLMRQRWQAAKLPQPEFRVCLDEAQIEAAAHAIGFPCILKPALGWGSRGVSCVHDETDLRWAIDFAAHNLHGGEKGFVVEAFIPGTGMTIEGLVQDGEAYVLTWSDKKDQEHPRYRVAMSLNYPAQFEPWQLDEARRVVKLAVRALSLNRCAFHCECIVNDEGVFLVELAARGGGGHIFGQIVETVSGVRMPVALVRILLGETLPLKKGPQRGACYRFFAPPPGIFHSATGIAEGRRQPGILDFGFDLMPGTHCAALECGASRPGYAVSEGRDRADAIANVERAVACMRYVVTPVKG